MIHDALLILWDCSQPVTKNVYTNEIDKEIFGKICDIAKSHHRIQNFIGGCSFRIRKIQAATGQKTCGLYAQALSEGISEVLQDYKETLVDIEIKVIENHNHTLSFVYSHVEKFHGLFNILNRLISTVKERRLLGCQILGLTHQQILSSNEAARKAILKLFSCINKVFVNQLCSWLLYGELKDPYNEFFIYKLHREDTASSDSFFSGVANTSTNDKKMVSSLQDMHMDSVYNINPNLIPYFVPLSLAQEILFIGKTVILFGCDPKKLKKSKQTFITKSLLPLQKYTNVESRRFTIWDEKEGEFHNKLQSLKNPEFFEVCNLRIVVRDVKECVTKHLWLVAVEEAQLIHELRLMKDFYLLGRGELFLELLRLTAHMLDHPTTRTSTRDMNQAFQLSARAVFLSNSADIEKFTFELPYVKHNISTSSMDDDSSIVADGWSSIILKYDFKWPLHLLFTPDVLAKYNDMFRLLLRIKKTQHDLHLLWKTYKSSTSFSMCQLHNKLMFLMDNLQHYLQADVLETNFCKLMEFVMKTKDFEKFKKAHASFLADILSQSFLTTSSGNSSCANDSTDLINNPVFCNIVELLKLCHSFCSMSETVADKESEDYYIRGYLERFNKLVKELMQLLVSLRLQPCGAFLARLLMRLDYNRWLSGEAQLTQSVTNMLR